jgi:hypothetical protein
VKLTSQLHLEDNFKNLWDYTSKSHPSSWLRASLNRGIIFAYILQSLLFRWHKCDQNRYFIVATVVSPQDQCG